MSTKMRGLLLVAVFLGTLEDRQATHVDICRLVLPLWVFMLLQNTIRTLLPLLRVEFYMSCLNLWICQITEE